MKNDELEKQVSIISIGNKSFIGKHYDKLRKLQVKISDKEALNFGIIELMVMVVIACSLIVSSKMFGTLVFAGNLIGIYNYILKFVSGLDTIPYSVQRFALLKDIIKRIENRERAVQISSGDEGPVTEKYTQGVLKLTA